MAPIKFVVLESRLMPSATPARAGKRDWMVMWREDDARDYVILVPEEDYSPEEALRRIRAEVQRRSLIVGHEETVGNV